MVLYLHPTIPFGSIETGHAGQLQSLHLWVKGPNRKYIMKTEMFYKNAVTWLVLLPALSAPFAAQAQVYGRHPRYLHARTDLRRAHFLLNLRDDPGVMRDMRMADDEVIAAIREIDQAAVLDRRDLQDNPPVDSRFDRPGRFREIFRLLQSARQDVAQEEDNPSAIGWRNLAYRHIDQALSMTRQAARADFREEWWHPVSMPREMPREHPHYLRALSDLRFARALLARPSAPNVMDDERRAIREIEEAIAECKRAAIDDGQNIDYHPPIDGGWGWGDRFGKAREALNSALNNLRYEEDDRMALGWRNRAIQDVSDAMAWVNMALRDRRWDRERWGR